MPDLKIPRSSLSRLSIAFAVIAMIAGCRAAPKSPAPAEALPPVSGALEMAGLSAPVRVVRDRWGIPHIYADNQDDLFFAQGFVQAEDRLFQMDLWRRSAAGRLSEVLGPNFIERDAMTRRIQFRGDKEADWASYAPDAKAIAEAFVRGINAYVARAREHPPEEFVLAGWLPEPWTADDLLNRTEAFGMTGNAIAEVLRARVMAAVGAERTAALLPLDPAVKVTVPAGLDPSYIGFIVGDALKRIGTAPFFMNLQGSDATHTGGSNNWVVAGARSATGYPLIANDPHRALDHPSLRYLVHLHAPGWNVIGSVTPWLPGVAIGHNERVGWGLTIFNADVQDLYVERTNPANPHQVEDHGRFVDTEIVKDVIEVKGRPKPFEFEREYTPHGVIVATDRERNLAFAMRWTGSEPGTTGYLAGLALDRASSAAELRNELARWKMPGENFVFADVDGNIGYQAAALVPVRRGWDGTMPAPGWNRAFEWQGWYSLDDLPHASNPSSGYVATANNNTLPPRERRVIGFEWGSPARINRLREVFAAGRVFSVDDFKRLQHDVRAWNAEQLVPLLKSVQSDRPDVEEARHRLLAWDQRLTADSADAAVYAVWERALFAGLVKGKLDAPLERDYAGRAPDDCDILVPALVKPSARWFGRDALKARDALLISALGAAVDELKVALGGESKQWTWGRLHTATFTHPLGMTDRTRSRFNVGPFERPGYVDTVMATYGDKFEQSGGASFREILDVENWDRSVGTSAPGQSGSPASPHFADLARLWAAGEYFPLSFSDAAVSANAETTLTLAPKK